MLQLKNLSIIESLDALSHIPPGKILINTINAHSYNTAQKDALFAEALQNGDYLIPDGASIVKACRWLKANSRPTERVAGWDLFEYEMRAPSGSPKGEGTVCEPRGTTCESGIESGGLKNGRRRVMFMGSSEKVLSFIRKRMSEVYPQWEVVTYSPPYKPEFSDEDNKAIISAINDADPDLLWIGMTAPKQEKWAYANWDRLNIRCHVGTIGAVFDFFAGTYKRAPLWWQEHSLEWLYRLLKEPRRMWRRYLIGNALFLWNIMKEARAHPVSSPR